jgi:hypothetical protein
MNDKYPTMLQPEVRVFKHSTAPPPLPAVGGAYSAAEGVRVWPLWDIAATPFYGRWIIRVDIYETTEEDKKP